MTLDEATGAVQNDRQDAATRWLLFPSTVRQLVLNVSRRRYEETELFAMLYNMHMRMCMCMYRNIVLQ